MAHEERRMHEKSLAAFLSDPSREALPKSEMAKLWKGIFYCAYPASKSLLPGLLKRVVCRFLDVRQAPGTTSTCHRDCRHSPCHFDSVCLVCVLARFLGIYSKRVELHRPVTVSSTYDTFTVTVLNALAIALTNTTCSSAVS